MRVQNLHLKTLRKLNSNGVVYKNYSLAKHTTFKIGGNAKYYIEINTLENFIKIINYLKEKEVDIFVLGNGSNILISDNGFNGAVIKLKGDFARIESRDEYLEVGGGVLLPQIYSYALDRSLSGMEEGGLIPATIGGAVYMNAQTGEYITANLVEYVVAFDGEKIAYFSKEDCQFGHKNSIFQSGNYVILRVGLKLTPKNKEDISQKREKALKYRKDNHPIEFPSAGCVYKKINDKNISKMLDDLGIKGKTIGGAYVSEKHANFILSNNAKSCEVYALMKEIERDFEEKYKFPLEREIILVGEFDEN